MNSSQTKIVKRIQHHLKQPQAKQPSTQRFSIVPDALFRPTIVKDFTKPAIEVVKRPEPKFEDQFVVHHRRAVTLQEQMI